MKKRIGFLLVFMIFIRFSVFSQEDFFEDFLYDGIVDIVEEIEEETNETEPEIITEFVSEDEIASEYEDDAVFIIDSFDFNIKGITRQFALINKGELKKGEQITGYANLLEYILNKQQLLYNQRALESVSIQPLIGQKTEDGKYPVELVITTKDSWNIIALPKPQYSTNSGFKLTINLRDYNFFGTLMPLRIDLGYRYDEKKRNYVSLMLDSDIPFMLFNLNWNFIFVNNFEYRPHFKEPYYFNNTTGLQVQLPLASTTVVIGFKESLFINQENADGDKPAFGDYQEGLYFSSNPYIHWVIPTGIEAGEHGQIYYVPYISASINHELSKWPLSDIKTDPNLAFGHSLSFGRIDWKENFRDGTSVNISNSYNYSFRNKRYELRPLDIYYQLSAIGHYILKEDTAGFSGRILYRHWLFSVVHTEAGDVLRGIPDNNVSANFMISLNFDFPVKVLEARPAQWFGIGKFRVFNFDLHLSPFLDIAIFHHPDHQTAFSFRNFLFSGGLEAVVFPQIIRSLNLRMSFGLNLTKFDLSPNSIKSGYDPRQAGRYEIYIGTDYHF